MNILDKFKEADLKKLAKANIPFVSSGSESKLAVRKMGYKVSTFDKKWEVLKKKLVKTI